MAVKRSVDELHSRVESFIKEQFTAIHPVVEWRFRKTVLGAMERPGHDHGQGEMDPIVFRDVHPLYAVSDIRGSSTHRAWAIQADLLHQQRRDAPGPEIRPDHVAHRGRAAVRVGLDPQVGRHRR